MNVNELRNAIQLQAKTYWNESGDNEQITEFPASIVDFVLEYAINNCHFPQHFDDNKILAVMEKYKTSLAMACVDVYAKAGAEGEFTHSENGITRQYSNSYIDSRLLRQLPNYVKGV